MLNDATKELFLCLNYQRSPQESSDFEYVGSYFNRFQMSHPFDENEKQYAEDPLLLQKHLDYITALCQREADVNAIIFDDSELALECEMDSYLQKGTPLEFAISQHSLPHVKLLLQLGADPHGRASEEDLKKITQCRYQRRIAIGAYATREHLFTSEDLDTNILCRALLCNFPEAALALIEAGSDLLAAHTQKPFAIPFFCAAVSPDCAAILPILISKGENASRVDEEGYNALHFAASNLCFEGIKTLLKLGLDPNGLTKNSGSAFHMIMSQVDDENHQKSLECLHLLLEHGGDPFAGSTADFNPFSFLSEEDEYYGAFIALKEKFLLSQHTRPVKNTSDQSSANKITPSNSNSSSNTVNTNSRDMSRRTL